MDKQVGRLVQKLKDTNEFDNTIFVFQSDNGPTGDGSAFPLRGRKGTSMEAGHRVPSFISGPGIIPGTLDSSKFMHISDWAPTLLDFAGFDLRKTNMDGHSFKNVFTADADSPRTDMFYFLNSQPIQESNSSLLILSQEIILNCLRAFIVKANTNSYGRLTVIISQGRQISILSLLR